MRIRNRLGVTAAASLLLALGACTATSNGQRSTGQVVDDSALTARVKTALIQNDATKARQIDVEVYRGVVQLNGFVDSAEAKTAATRAAQGINGVASVRNNLEIRAAHRTAGETLDDGVITARVKTALIGDPRTKAYQIEVNTNEGVVQLGGFVDNSTAKSAAAEVARSVQGVRTVRNELDVKE